MEIAIQVMIVLLTVAFVSYPLFRSRSVTRAVPDSDIEKEILKLRRKSTLSCPKCRVPFPTDARFCPQCGTIRPTNQIVCPKCGSGNPCDARFCSECATKLTKDN